MAATETMDIAQTTPEGTMNSPLLTPHQLHEMDVRMNGMPPHLPVEAFSAQLAKVIGREEDLRFGLMLVKNALELGQVDLALQQCNKALGVE